MSLCVQNYDNAHVLPSFSCLFCSQQGWVAAQTAALLTAPGKLRRGAAVSAERLSGPRCRRGGCTRPWATLHTAADNPPGGIPARQSPSTSHVSQRQSRLIPSTYKYFATFAAQMPCPLHYMGTTDVHASKTNREQGHQLTKTHNHIKPTHIYSLF